MSETVQDMNKAFFQHQVETYKVTLPSGQGVEIRESNGEDEEVLSKVAYVKDGTSYYRYLANIIVEPRVNHEEVKKWKSTDIYYAMFKSRLISLGSSMEFEYEFADG